MVATKKVLFGLAALAVCLFMVPVFWLIQGIGSVVSERMALIAGFLGMLLGIFILVRPMDLNTKSGLCRKS